MKSPDWGISIFNCSNYVYEVRWCKLSIHVSVIKNDRNSSNPSFSGIGISTVDPVRFQALTHNLDFQHQAMAHGLSQHAEERRKTLEKELSEKGTTPH